MTLKEKILLEIKERQLAKGVKKYGDNNIKSRRTKKELINDTLEELQDAVNYLEALEEDTLYDIKYNVKKIMERIANFYVKEFK